MDRAPARSRSSINTSLTFIVTTAADSGPGSLRQGFTNASLVTLATYAINFAPALARSKHPLVDQR